MSLSAVHGTLSSLKSCQSDINTGMDIVTDVALDLVETPEADGNGLKELEDAMLTCARLDRDIQLFVETVQQVTSEVSQSPEAMISLSQKVKTLFEQNLDKLCDDELLCHQKVLNFKESIRSCQNQAGADSGSNMEELDEDIAVSQSQVNLSCPLTQVEMVNPVKNKKCNHHYEQEAIISLIKNRHKQKKKCRCPVVGCGNSDVKESDLILDQVLRRRIQSQKRSSKS